MNGIDKIELVLENCEIITIEGKYLGEFYIGDIRTEIRRIACNAIEKMPITHKVVIEVNRSANVIDKESSFSNNVPIFDRICKCADITSVVIYYDKYDDGDTDQTASVSEQYYVHWTGDSEYVNASQYSTVTSQGDLRIAIMENYNESDYFDVYNSLEEEKEMTDFQWEMYS